MLESHSKSATYSHHLSKDETCTRATWSVTEIYALIIRKVALFAFNGNKMVLGGCCGRQVLFYYTLPSGRSNNRFHPICCTLFCIIMPWEKPQVCPSHSHRTLSCNDILHYEIARQSKALRPMEQHYSAILTAITKFSVANGLHDYNGYYA